MHILASVNAHIQNPKCTYMEALFCICTFRLLYMRFNASTYLGGEIGLEETCSLALCALVGRLSYRVRSGPFLEDWVHLTWALLLGYTPEVVTLTRGWFFFLFKTLEDSEKVLSRNWIVKEGILMLKH